MFNSILVVCNGNISRSPVAACLLRQLLPEKKIDSAGISAAQGAPAEAIAVVEAEKHGLFLHDHLSTPFTSLLGNQYDLILVMEKSHQEKIGRTFPEVRGKTMLLGHWLSQRDIPGTHRKSQEAFEYVYQLIDQSCRSWTVKLNR